jgi:cobalt-zinc-cadmium efflux system protein
MRPPHEHPVEESQRLLKIGILLSFLIFLLELFGGLWTHSLAMMSDAWHIFIDIWALVVSFFAVYVAKRPANDRQTFGFHRMEVFAAMINGFTVFLIAVGILYSAWKRFLYPSDVHAERLIVLAGVGLVLNLIVAGLFYKPSQKDMNIRGAFLHMVGDALNTLAVIIAAAIMLITKYNRADPIVSVFIAVVVLWGSGRLLKDAVNTLLEGVPKGIEVGAVEREIQRVPGVLSVHDLHVWSICSHLNALSGHVLLGPDHMNNQCQVLEVIGKTLKDRFGIAHTTIQVESKGWPNMERLEEAQHL